MKKIQILLVGFLVAANSICAMDDFRRVVQERTAGFNANGMDNVKPVFAFAMLRPAIQGVEVIGRMPKGPRVAIFSTSLLAGTVVFAKVSKELGE